MLADQEMNELLARSEAYGARVIVHLRDRRLTAVCTNPRILTSSGEARHKFLAQTRLAYPGGMTEELWEMCMRVPELDSIRDLIDAFTRGRKTRTGR